MDEASQVDLATGVLALSCARNVVIVGDLEQLPNVLTQSDICTSDAIWQQYNNFEVIQSRVRSVFDMLYKGYAEQRRAYLQKHRQISEYDSENLIYAVIRRVLSEEPFSAIGCAVHVSLAALVKDYAPLTEDERGYARNPLTHIDFLLFGQMDKPPILAIEVDGTAFHRAGSKLETRDEKKNSIMEKCGLSLLRLRTDGSGEEEKIRSALQAALNRQAQ